MYDNFQVDLIVKKLVRCKANYILGARCCGEFKPKKLMLTASYLNHVHYSHAVNSFVQIANAWTELTSIKPKSNLTLYPSRDRVV